MEFINLTNFRFDKFQNWQASNGSKQSGERWFVFFSKNLEIYWFEEFWKLLLWWIFLFINLTNFSVEKLWNLLNWRILVLTNFGLNSLEFFFSFSQTNPNEFSNKLDNFLKSLTYQILNFMSDKLWFFLKFRLINNYQLRILSLFKKCENAS